MGKNSFLLLVMVLMASVTATPVTSNTQPPSEDFDVVMLEQDDPAATPDPSTEEPVLEEIDGAEGNATAAGNATAPVVEVVDPEPWRDLIEPIIHTCPMDCNYRGICNLGFCECKFPYDGRACEKEMCGLKQKCNDHGTCTNNTLSLSPSHVCLCDDGWTGSYCAEKDDECPYACLGHGTCDDGVCVCNPGWKGDYCQHIHCEKDCSGHGDCLQGTGDVGGYCNCTSPWHTNTCEIATCPGDCSGNGICNIRTGVCLCNDTYEGIACELRTCPNNCSWPQGDCNRNSGGCTCRSLYQGYDCSDELCPNLCSGHGTCQQDGKCVCDTKWGDVDCSDDLCYHNCSYHGICGASGQCYCHAYFDGDLCDIDLRCPNNCSGHGKCHDARCNCTGGWSAWDCSVSPFQCPSDFECVNGNCTHGSCECARGWRDYDCSLPVVRMCTSDSECYHGRCDDLGQCVCQLPWTGDFCERYMPYPLPVRENGVYPLPDPKTSDDTATLHQKLSPYEEHYRAARCGKYGGQRCGSSVYRHPYPKTERTIVPMGIRHSSNRAKANATHAANGTFWGDIWGNATEMWEEIREQEAEQAALNPTPIPEAPPAGTNTTEIEEGVGNHVQMSHEHHNVKMARKHYNHARLLKRFAAASGG